MRRTSAAIMLVILLSPMVQAQQLHGNKTPENYTLSLELEVGSAYVSGKAAEETTYSPSEMEFPYIVSPRPAGIVSYGEVKAVSYEAGATDIFTVTQSSGGFILPFTRGGYQEIEDEQGLVSSRNLLNQLEPSFGFPMPSNPVVKVVLQPEYAVKAFSNAQRGSIEIAVRNVFGGNTTILMEPL